MRRKEDEPMASRIEMVEQRAEAVNEFVMEAAWELVCPVTHWKDPVNAVVTAKQMRAAGVTMQDIADAVDFYTATRARFKLVSSLEPAYVVTAKGYRAGPAGDH
jgi:hypothetical protein